MSTRQKWMTLSMACLIGMEGITPEACAATKGGKSDVQWNVLQDYNVPEWFKDAKFGIYAHWGPATRGTYGAQDDWYAGGLYNEQCRRGKSYRYHKEAFGDPSEVGYKDIIKMFDPSGFDAEYLGQLYADTGAKLAGPVAIHHDNFAMWDSKISRWNSVNYGGIDVSGELEKAIRERGLKYMMSSHLAFSWYFFRPSYDFDGADPQYRDLYHTPHEGKIDVKPNPAKNGPKPNQVFNDMWLAKMKEMVDLYSPDLMWFDFGPETLKQETLKEYFTYYFGEAKKRGREPVVTYKHAAKRAVPRNLAVRDHERSRPQEIMDEFWLTDTSIGPWYYEKGHEETKLDNSELIKMLVDIVSKNGALLFNVPLKIDGSVPVNTRELMLETGKWLKINGDAIYGTRPWKKYGEGPHTVKVGRLKKANMYDEKDVRFTTKEKSLYAIVLGVPQSTTYTVASASKAEGTVTKVSMLSVEGDLEFTQDEKGLHITVPASIPSVHANTFRIEGLL